MVESRLEVLSYIVAFKRWRLRGRGSLNTETLRTYLPIEVDLENGAQVQVIEGGTAEALLIGKKKLFVVFRETEQARDFLFDLDTYNIEWEGRTVYRGFLRAWERIAPALKAAIPLETEEIVFCGFSLGGVLSQIAATVYQHKSQRASFFSFGAPCWVFEEENVDYGWNIIFATDPMALSYWSLRMRYLDFKLTTLLWLCRVVFLPFWLSWYFYFADNAPGGVGLRDYVYIQADTAVNVSHHSVYEYFFIFKEVSEKECRGEVEKKPLDTVVTPEVELVSRESVCYHDVSNVTRPVSVVRGRKLSLREIQKYYDYVDGANNVANSNFHIQISNPNDML